jgi:invasion protein IalB
MVLAWLPAEAAERRIALVIGNSAYRSAAELPNARNDAKTVAKLLTDAGFDVVQSKSDLGVEEFRRVLRDFADLSDNADVALVYFAGHGIELSGANYLVPVDARLARDRDAEDEAISLDRLLHTVEPARRLKLVILDACRENPFVAKMSRLSPTRSIGRGLARVEPTASDTLVAFAAKAGSMAGDGDGTNSPFTKALLAHLTTPGLDVRIALGRVRDQVLKDTNRQQEPFVYGSLGGDIVSLVPTKTQTASLTPPSAPLPASQPVSKTQSTDIGSVRSIHDQWQVRCQLAGTPPQDQCAVIQSVTAEDRPAVGMTVILLRSTDKKIMLRVVAPLGILMPSGLGLKIDGKDIGRAGFVRCLANGCIAEVIVDDALLGQLKGGKVAQFIIFQTAEEGIGIPISLAGLAAGLGDLPP